MTAGEQRYNQQEERMSYGKRYLRASRLAIAAALGLALASGWAVAQWDRNAFKKRIDAARATEGSTLIQYDASLTTPTGAASPTSFMRLTGRACRRI